MKLDLKTNSTLKVPELRREYSLRNKELLHRRAIAAAIMFSWILIWALVFKLGSESILLRNYTNLKDMTLEERIMWDLIPFNYDGTKGSRLNLIMDTVLNCFVFSPLAVLLCFVFEKPNIFRDGLICLGISLSIEILQLFTMLGNPATEDLITNLAGCLIGYVIYLLLFKRLTLRQIVTAIGVFNVLLVVMVIYSLVTTIGAAELVFKIVTRTL